jgi:Chalcone isomerase-like
MSKKRFYLDGKLLGEIADVEFAQAFFAIWLDPRTSASNLRKQLLAIQP